MVCLQWRSEEGARGALYPGSYSLFKKIHMALERRSVKAWDGPHLLLLSFGESRRQDLGLGETRNIRNWITQQYLAKRRYGIFFKTIPEKSFIKFPGLQEISPVIIDKLKLQILKIENIKKIDKPQKKTKTHSFR